MFENFCYHLTAFVKSYAFESLLFKDAILHTRYWRRNFLVDEHLLYIVFICILNDSWPIKGKGKSKVIASSQST